MPRTEQDKGRSYEKKFAERLGAKEVVNSGSLWFAKLDVGDKTIRWSLKHTGKDFFRLSKNVLIEAIRHAAGFGSAGEIPGWAVDIAGTDFVILRADDFIALFEEGYEIPPSVASQKRHRASIPVALRPREDEDETS